MKRLFACLLLLLCAVLSGCATNNVTPPLHFAVLVDSIAAENRGVPKTYVIGSGDNKISSGDLHFREYAEQVEKALAVNGYVKAASPDDAAILIALVYGISDPKDTTSSYAMPVFGQTGVAASNTYGRIGAGGTFSATTTNTPSFGVTGYVPITENQTTYTRYFVATAFDINASKASGKDTQLWKTTVTSSGSSGDLRYVFPYMVYATQPYLGSNTGKKIEVKVMGDAPGVAQYRPATQPVVTSVATK
ncbi:hypothetical protein [Dechloromonas sp. CZR5]|uniref:hypothetical protein n=1 Tax=Dechloromonas sp. CZR5 TaxID=2608630 RepID=UPI00123DF069|nr:hypothetical protein [Dechloromonas sp. CZR5]